MSGLLLLGAGKGDCGPLAGCLHCAGESPEEWTFSLVGGTGDFADAEMAGDYTVTYAGGCQWTGTKGDNEAVYAVEGASAVRLTVTNATFSVSAEWIWSAGSPCSGPVETIPDSFSGVGDPPSWENDGPTLTASP